jgi:hypothetical protein
MYTVHSTDASLDLQRPELGAEWQRAEVAELTHFHPRSSDHRPKVSVRVLHQQDALTVAFDVQDRYVRSTRMNYQDGVCRDSCVEFFVQPRPDKGYFNFEVNAGGTLLLYYITDHIQTDGGFRESWPVTWEVAKAIEIHGSLPRRVEPELTMPVAWWIRFRIPLSVFEAYTGPLGALSGQTWRGNFYKCADETSHPHWASWLPVGEPLNFHKPECFGPIRLA